MEGKIVPFILEGKTSYVDIVKYPKFADIEPLTKMSLAEFNELKELKESKIEQIVSKEESVPTQVKPKYSYYKSMKKRGQHENN